MLAALGREAGLVGRRLAVGALSADVIYRRARCRISLERLLYHGAQLSAYDHTRCSG